jgi:hypothetical protein
MLKARRDSTHKQYNSYIAAWFSYCTSNNLSPTSATVPQALQFLHHLRISRNLGYSALNTARSALSTILKDSDGIPFGKNADVKLFLSGLFNDNPPQPRYVATWDPDTVLNMLKTWAPAKKLDFKCLTSKVAVLILLVSGQRLQTLP